MSDTVKMKIIRDCFVSDNSVIIRDGKPVERRKVFAGEEHDLCLDDATLLDEKGLAKQVMDRKPKKAEADAKAPA